MKSTSSVTVIDYGIGNLLNVVRALEHCGARTHVIENAAQISSLPERLILPGVGAFADGMREMRLRGFDDMVKAYVQTERPLLGICVGAQMLLDIGEEFGEHLGLGLIPGRVKAVPEFDAQGKRHRIPHIGWSALQISAPRLSWGDTILKDLPSKQAVYFVHSFAPSPDNSMHRLANTRYNGIEICAAVAKNNIYGCQFHPEKSGELGLKILSNFLEV
jgi:imidazole glycerol-phosphate synthase subunit HisH